jgi:general secretion pathway protein K
MSRQRSSEQGMALIAVTLLLIVLSTIALAAITDARLSAKSVAIGEIRYRARLAAEGAIHEAIYDHLTTPSSSKQGMAGGTFDVGGLSVELVTRSESGLININRAKSDLLSALFASNGVPEPKALRLAAAVVDWRDADNLKEPGGAEAPEYRALKLTDGPRNGYFETKGELIEVKGMSDELYRCIDSHLTVFSTSGEVDLSAAPDNVLAVFRWARANRWQDREWVADVSSGTSILNPYGPSGGSAYNLVARTTGERGVPFALRATIRLTRGAQRAFSVLEWRESFDLVRSEVSCPQAPNVG